jgi:hypothetical protein
MTYTSKFIEDKRYEITTEFNGEPITFNVVVANDESEVEGVVSDYLHQLANPRQPENQTATQPDLMSVIQNQQSLIQQLQDDVAALKGSK